MGKMITICGGCGSGKTTVAANLGYVLSQKYLVGIVATDMYFGSIQHLLGTKIGEPHGLYGLIKTKDDVSKAFTLCAGNQNLFLLSLADNHDCLILADEESGLSGEEAKEVLSQMQENFQFLIVDCEPEINNPLSVYSLVQADQIINLIKPTVLGTAFWNSYRPLLSALRIDNDKIIHVANADKNYAGVKNIERAAGVKFSFVIPHCGYVEQAENSGIPACKNKSGEFRAAIEQIAGLIKEG